jgi:hypothetical protein
MFKALRSPVVGLGKHSSAFCSPASSLRFYLTTVLTGKAAFPSAPGVSTGSSIPLLPTIMTFCGDWGWANT